MQCTYVANYVLDANNVHWGGEVNLNHIFDIYSEYHPQKNSVRTRLDMISFVISDSHRYAWNGHLFLQLNNMTLHTWIKKMSYWINCADALSLYALSDMYGMNTCVKPWTSLDKNFKGTVDDLIKICQVKLVYLRQNKFGRLWEKTIRDTLSFFGANYNYQPMVAVPTPPLSKE